MLGPPLDSSNAIWDDGEWISWDEINRALAKDEPQPEPDLGDTVGHETIQEKLKRLDDMIDGAWELIDRDQRELINFGEMGELYAEIRYNLKRHRPCAEGSDGRIGNDYAEVKTITPWKTKLRVTVRRSGHFNKLIVVKIDDRFMFDTRIISRSRLTKGSGGQTATVSWSSMPRLNSS